MNEQGRIPPNAVELEEAVLGAALLFREAVSDVVDILTPDAFYKPQHVVIYEAIRDLFAEDKPVELLSVTLHLKNNGKLEAAGGAVALSRLTDRIASPANVEYHARIIQQKHIQRELIRVTGEVYMEAFEDTADALTLMERIGGTVEAVASRLSGSRSETMGNYARTVIERAELAKTSQGLTGQPTGFKDLDRIHGGRHGGQLTIIAGRPAMGKSALALCEAMHMAEKGASVLFISLEMGSVELTQRAMSVDTGIWLERFKTGDLDPDQWAALNKSAAKWGALKLHIVDDVSTLTGIRAEARRIKERQGLDAIYIDYLQLVQHSLSGRNRENEVSEVSRSLKLLSRSLNVPVVALSQLSRGVEARGNKRPQLADLRESGAIEQDADVVEFVFRPEYYGIDTVDEIGSTQGLAIRIIAKNRHGALADLPMRFEGKMTRFTDWEGQQVQRAPVPESLPYGGAMRPNTNFYEKQDDEPF